MNEALTPASDAALAAEIRQAVEDLNRAIAAATQAGVTVALDTVEGAMPDGPSFPMVTVEIKREVAL